MTASLSDRIGATEDEVHKIREMGLARDEVIAIMTSDLAENTATTKRIEAAVETNRVLASESVKALNDSIAGLLDFFNSVKGAFKVLDWLGKLARPLGYIAAFAAACASLWYSVRHGGPPSPP